VFVALYHVQTMYNIKQAAARAGVTVPVLRAWERRYGIVRPPRTSSGYRQFDDAAIDRIRTMRALVDDGWSPSAAAAAILAGEAPTPPGTGAAVRDPGGGSGATERADRNTSTAAPEAGAFSERIIAASRALDSAALDAVLDDLFSRGSFERVATDFLFPALHALGEAWASGAVSVAGEHLASHAVLRRLGQALEGAGAGDARGPRIVVGLPPGGRHELGALAFAVAARRAGLSVTYVGPDLPAEDWVAASGDADGAVIGVVTGRDRRAAIDVANRLLAAHPRLVVAFGGGAAPTTPEVLRLPDTLPTSVTTLKAALNAAAATPASPTSPFPGLTRGAE
jgi:MerR family transcriptional regulator, light-induced transcriptional regulator